MVTHADLRSLEPEDLLENFGFDYGVSRVLGRASWKSNNLFLPRLPVNNWDDEELLRAKPEGGYY